MTSTWFLRAALLGLLSLAFSWMVLWLSLGRPVLACAGAVAIVLVHAPVMAMEMMLACWHNRTDPAPPPSLREMLVAWWRETIGAIRIFAWQQPFASMRFADRLPLHRSPDQGIRGPRGVILIHGFICNRGVWNPWWPRLIHRHVPTIALNLQPVFASIDAYALHIEAAVRRMTALTGRAPVIVAHSMGGLAVRAWLRAHPGHSRVHHVVTVGSPHRGTWLARFGHGVNAREMRHGAEWFTPLEAMESSQPGAKFTCYYSHCDNIVFPCSSATLPNADNRHLRGYAHVHLLTHPLIIEETIRLCEE